MLDSFGDSDVVVATVDSGCRLEHPCFGGREKFAGWGYFDDDQRLQTMNEPGSQAVRMSSPGQHHGTSMNALISGVVGDIQPIGVAPTCRLAPIRLLTHANRAHVSDDQVLRVLDYVAELADIVVISWSKVPYFVPSGAVVDRIDELTLTGGRRGSGIVFVCAAGNSNCPIEFSSDIAIPYAVDFDNRGLANVRVKTSKTFRNILTHIPGVLHVGSISSAAQRCHYSCYGPGIDLCAPSSNSRAFSGEVLRGIGLTTATADPTFISNQFKGTSGAAALVAGTAALALSAGPNLSAAEVCRLLQTSASKDLNFAGYEQPPIPARERQWDRPPIEPFANGVFDGDGWSPWFGYGKVDALQAVTSAQNLAYQPNDVTNSRPKSGTDGGLS